MRVMDRLSKKDIISDLKDYKMVFLAGPRQVGKTTLSQNLYKSFDYMNWDIDEHRTRILKKEFKKSHLWVFDEIHKYKKWRNFLKGIYDQNGKEQKILVTGSAKLDILRKGGDSLQGRYFFHRLLPLTFNELQMRSQKDLNYLYNLSGFPEPFLKGSKKFADRWTRQYKQRLIREEVSANEQFQDLATIEIMYNRLPELVTQALSINSLSEDLQVAHITVSKWIDALERLYGLFRVKPFGSPNIKAVKKAQRIYFFDWNAISDEGSRFENLIAVHLLSHIYMKQDVFGEEVELKYYRDKYDREVDFVMTNKGKPTHFIEVKMSDSETNKGLVYLSKKFPDSRFLQIHLNGKKEYINKDGIEHMPASKFLLNF